MLTYIKGQGWVEEHEEDILTLACGAKIRVEYRKPKRGEYYRTAFASGSSLHSNGVISNKWRKSISVDSLISLSVYYSRGYDDFYFYITLVPV